MQQIHTFTDVNRVLAEQFMPPASVRIKFSLERMRTLMKLLDNPQNELRVVHVAGTSGKTSTCYYTSALLAAGGKKVGMTVSPHVDQINERIQLNLVPLPEETFCAYFIEFLRIPGLIELQPSYFEVMIAFAFWVFVRERVDYAVVEVGLGGLGDATNVVDRPDKVCVITDIGLDHMQVLGDTITEIAFQKAGIVQQHNPVVTLEQSAEVLQPIQDRAQQEHAALTVVSPEPLEFLTDIPPFAARNWQLAQAVYELIAARDELPELSQEALTKTAHTLVPARMEVVQVGEKTVVLDGSHNQQKLEALRRGLEARFGSQPKALLTSFVQTKRNLVAEAAAEIIPAVQGVIITSYDTKQDNHHSSLPTDEIEAACRAAGATDVQVIADPQSAFQALLQRPEPILVVTGSFYLLNHIRPIIKKSLKED